MGEEKKEEVESFNEDEKAEEDSAKKEEEEQEEEEKEEEEAEDDEQKSEEEGAEEEEDDDFEKKEETVSANKYNQAVRKAREIEVEKRDLEKKLEEQGGGPQKKEDKKKKDEDDDSFFDDLADDDEDEEKVDEKVTKKAEALVDKKMKPILEQIAKKEKQDRKADRTVFFEAHPEYLNDSEKWNGLLEELDDSINPHSDMPYLQQLEKAHVLYSGESAENQAVTDKKKDMAGDAASGGGEGKGGAAEEEFTAEEKQHMKDWNISPEGMRAAKKKLESGKMQIL